MTAQNKHLIFVLVCSVALVQLSAQKITFPGTRSEIKSPDGHYMIKNTDDETRELSHSLSVIDTKNNEVTKIYQYGRSVDILWSPNSDAFIVNDHEGSNMSHPVLFTKPWTVHPLDLFEKLLPSLSNQESTKHIQNNIHVYFDAERWLGHGAILCRLYGYGDGDPNGFTKYYIYKMGEGFKTAPSQTGRRDSRK
ncbi:MAG: hypothetical protein ABR889_00165 [Acidobacteriaceae bacterium]|jgi:hypothetical protein